MGNQRPQLFWRAAIASRSPQHSICAIDPTHHPRSRQRSRFASPGFLHLTVAAILANHRSVLANTECG